MFPSNRYIQLKLAHLGSAVVSAGEPLTVTFAGRMLSSQKQSALRAAPVPLRAISFDFRDPASHQLLTDPSFLATSEGTLAEAHGVRWAPPDFHENVRTLSFAQRSDTFWQDIPLRVSSLFMLALAASREKH